jgi:hypothetical protein
MAFAAGISKRSKPPLPAFQHPIFASPSPIYKGWTIHSRLKSRNKRGRDLSLDRAASSLLLDGDPK